ncbi:hypothetical protein M2271_006339 [Streptomyces sp. LBL]|uniref:hypothetical protein n=1 Tax=Streptomyces sp. LBL TaxID=2940562 RepID=UPI002473EC9D|nr:hypothetical protein [Streptomyces sp. LBL]MDH6628506.1 hypothetical protein [Streptomyces sp. LBL]
MPLIVAVQHEVRLHVPQEKRASTSRLENPPLEFSIIWRLSVHTLFAVTVQYETSRQITERGYTAPLVAEYPFLKRTAIDVGRCDFLSSVAVQDAIGLRITKEVDPIWERHDQITSVPSSRKAEFTNLMAHSNLRTVRPARPGPARPGPARPRPAWGVAVVTRHVLAHFWHDWLISNVEDAVMIVLSKTINFLVEVLDLLVKLVPLRLQLVDPSLVDRIFTLQSRYGFLDRFDLSPKARNLSLIFGDIA